MEDQYGMADLRQYIGTRPNFFPPPPDLLSSHLGLSQPAHPYDMLVFRSDSTNSTAPTTAINNIAGSSAAAVGFGGFESGLSFGGVGGDGGAGRWPRQETLTLLEIRSRLDSKFKEANQKGPLWDEVSRIMSEEHGYQRSGKKCREKFENLYKYYKKTKEGKAGRQDGKHYRFFRQLEALYGEANNNNNNSEAHHHHHHHHMMMGTSTTFDHYMNYKEEPFQATPKFSDNTSLSLSNYSEADTTTSSDDTDLINEGTTDDNNNNNNNEAKNKKRSGKTDWKVKIKDMVDLQMNKLMDKQEAWMEKMMTTMEHKERERMMREEEWRKQDAARIESEHKYWASERAWIETRDSALMEALHKLTGKELIAAADIYRNSNNHETVKGEIWPENDEISRLVELKRGMDGKDEQQQREGCCLSENVFWEEKMSSSFGHDKDKWESVNNYLIKKRKENTKRCSSYYNHASNQLGGEGGIYCDHHNSEEQGIDDQPPVIRLNNSSPNNNNNNNAISDQSCFRYFMGDGYGRI